MNNYCGKCGKKLEQDKKVCSECESQKKVGSAKGWLIIVLIIFLGIGAYIGINIVVNNNKHNKIKKDYIEPYLKENYSDVDYKVEYNQSGKCIVSGNCKVDITMGCDGGACDEYQYLSEEDCKSYYYDVKTEDKTFILTVVDMKDKKYVVEGINIYGIEEDEE